MTPVDIYAAFFAPALLIAGAYALLRLNRSSVLAASRTSTAADTSDKVTQERAASS